MNTDYTHITFVVDRSGSMSNCWTDTIGGLKSFITEQKEDKSKCTFSLYNFDNVIEQNLNFTDIQLVSENVEDFGFSPRGGTALYDAIGKAVNETGEALRKLAEKDRPGRVVVVIQTDGEENQSREFTASSIKKLVENQTEKYNWTFQFIGADEKSVLDAQDHLGFKSSNAAFYLKGNTKGTFDVLNSKLSMTRGASYAEYSSGVTMAFTEEEKTAMSQI